VADLSGDKGNGRSKGNALNWMTFGFSINEPHQKPLHVVSPPEKRCLRCLRGLDFRIVTKKASGEWDFIYFSIIDY
jgi:hypothetical protein